MGFQLLSTQDQEDAAAPIMNEEGGDDENEPGPRQRARRTHIDLNHVWKLYNDSVQMNGMSLSMLVKSRKNDPEGGASQQASSYWLKKIMRMYIRRATLGFKDVKCLNMVCDASRHGVHDCLVTVAYSQENNIGCYLPTQALRSSKFVSPGEIQCDTAVERLLAEGSRLRLSGYRLFQALSHQIQLLTDHTLSLNSFMAPEEMQAALEPVPLDVTRVVTRHFGTLVKKWRGTVYCQFAVTGKVAPACGWHGPGVCWNGMRSILERDWCCDGSLLLGPIPSIDSRPKNGSYELPS